LNVSQIRATPGLCDTLPGALSTPSPSKPLNFKL